MDKKLLFRTYFPFCLIWFLDYFIKSWFIAHPYPFNLGFIHFSYVENHGIMLGKLSEIPAVLKTVFLSTAGIAVVTSLPLSIAIYKFRSSFTLIGLSLVLSGILGNVTDRIIYGFVVDYIFIEFSTYQTPVLNFADVVQWFGYAFLFTGMIQEINFHNPENEKRSGGWINKSFQLKFTLSLISIFVALGSIFTVCGYTFLKYSLIELNMQEKVINHYLNLYTLTSLIIMGVSSLVIMLIGKTISHRITGPCYAIKRYLQDSLAGKHYPLRLRDDDYLKELEEPLTEVNNKLLPDETKKSA